MNRKLTEKEIDFLLALRELMANHNVLLSSEDDNVRIDIGYFGADDFEPVVLTEPITAFYDLDEFIEQNS